MFHSSTPCALFLSQMETLRSLLPGVRDGKPLDVHDARVATRRIRELLHFANGSSTKGDELMQMFRKVGCALGRVRDADVRIAVLTAMESRLPAAAPWLVAVRQTQERDRLKLIRAVVKKLEGLGIDNLIEPIRPGAGARGLFGSAAWRSELTRRLATRGRAAAEAIVHATGVYFPNRVHAARIALKKLRYAMEVVGERARSGLDGDLRALEEAQDILGDLHDRQALLDDLPSGDSLDGQPADPNVAVVRQLLEAEIQELHERYLTRREDLLQIARRAQSIRMRTRWALPSLVTAGALALGTGAVAAAKHSD
jgi:CHAD domain-containing protein